MVKFGPAVCKMKGTIDCIHSKFLGSYSILSFDGFCYFLIFVDDCNGVSFYESYLNTICEKEEIVRHHIICKFLEQLVVECMNRFLFRKPCRLLSMVSLPKGFWF